MKLNSEIKPPFKVFTSLDSVRLKSKCDSELVQENSVKFANFSKINSSPNSEQGRIINAWNDLKQEAGIIDKIKVSVSWVLNFRLWHAKLNWFFLQFFHWHTLTKYLRLFKENLNLNMCWGFGNYRTGKFLSKAHILGSTNPQYDKRLFIDLPVQYMKTTSSEHVLYTNCFFVFVLTFHGKHFMYTTCSELVVFMY